MKNIDYWRAAPVWTPKKIKKATKIWFSLLKNEKKIQNIKNLSKKLQQLKKKGKKIILCHGVFDILHIGHIKHFESAKKNGKYFSCFCNPR